MKKSRKLTLKREAIKHLVDLASVHGGDGAITTVTGWCNPTRPGITVGCPNAPRTFQYTACVPLNTCTCPASI